MIKFSLFYLVFSFENSVLIEFMFVILYGRIMFDFSCVVSGLMCFSRVLF